MLPLAPPFGPPKEGPVGDVHCFTVLPEKRSPALPGGGHTPGALGSPAPELWVEAIWPVVTDDSLSFEILMVPLMISNCFQDHSFPVLKNSFCSNLTALWS